MQIWRYPLTITDQQILLLPIGAKPLSAQMLKEPINGPQLWILCDENAVKESRTIAIYGTGDSLPDEPGNYIGTLQEGYYIWHVFLQE